MNVPGSCFVLNKYVVTLVIWLDVVYWISRKTYYLAKNIWITSLPYLMLMYRMPRIFPVFSLPPFLLFFLFSSVCAPSPSTAQYNNNRLRMSLILVECLPNMHEALGWIPITMDRPRYGGVCLKSQHSGSRGRRIWSSIQVILSYTVSWRPAWATWNCLKKKFSNVQLGKSFCFTVHLPESSFLSRCKYLSTHSLFDEHRLCAGHCCRC